MNESRIANLADGLWHLSVAELKAFRGVIEKILAAKEAVEAAEERSTEVVDRAAAKGFREIREYFEDAAVDLSGPEAVILGSYYMHEDGHDSLDSKRLNIFLDSYDRKPANSTSIVEKLSARGAVKVDDGGPHTHKKFHLTAQGRQEAVNLLGNLRRGGGLSVVGG